MFLALVAHDGETKKAALRNTLLFGGRLTRCFCSPPAPPVGGVAVVLLSFLHAPEKGLLPASSPPPASCFRLACESSFAPLLWRMEGTLKLISWAAACKGQGNKVRR